MGQDCMYLLEIISIKYRLKTGSRPRGIKHIHFPDQMSKGWLLGPCKKKAENIYISKR